MEKKIIGAKTLVDIAGVLAVPAKIDTGADTSAVWASEVTETDHGISFVLFDEGTPYFTGKRIEALEFETTAVRSSYGDRQERYKVKLPIVMEGEKFETWFTLANRARNRLPILIGRNTLAGRFLVDVEKEEK